MTIGTDERLRERELADSPFGIHEALHTCSVLMDTFGTRVALGLPIGGLIERRWPR